MAKGIRGLTKVSIHAPVRVRLNDSYVYKAKGCFNSRTREGATGSKLFNLFSNMSKVSIHAPVRVRHLLIVVYYGLSCFNSRTREGATSIRCMIRVTLEFQFTHP